MRFSKIVIVVMTLLGIMACNTPNNGDNGGGGNTDDKWSNNGSPVGEWVLTEWNNSAELPMGESSETMKFVRICPIISVSFPVFSKTKRRIGTVA